MGGQYRHYGQSEHPYPGWLTAEWKFLATFSEMAAPLVGACLAGYPLTVPTNSTQNCERGSILEPSLAVLGTVSGCSTLRRITGGRAPDIGGFHAEVADLSCPVKVRCVGHISSFYRHYFTATGGENSSEQPSLVVRSWRPQCNVPRIIGRARHEMET